MYCSFIHPTIHSFTHVLCIHLFIHLLLFRSEEDSLTAMSETVRESYRRFQKQEQSLKEIANNRQFAITTIENHLATALELGFPLDTARYWDKIGVSKE